MLKKLSTYISYGFKTFILGREIPYLLIFVLTDKCNLNCFYCESKNSGKYHFSYSKATEAIQSAYTRGHRSIGITGGEPTCKFAGRYGHSPCAVIAQLVSQEVNRLSGRIMAEIFRI